MANSASQTVRSEAKSSHQFQFLVNSVSLRQNGCNSDKCSEKSSQQSIPKTVNAQRCATHDKLINILIGKEHPQHSEKDHRHSLNVCRDTEINTLVRGLHNQE